MKKTKMTKRSTEMMNRRDTYICLTASHFLFKSRLKAQSAKPLNYKDAEQVSMLLNLTFAHIGKEFAPEDLIKPENDEINLSLEYFNLYKDYSGMFPEVKESIDLFAQWYVSDHLEEPEEYIRTGQLRMTSGIIMYMGNTLLDAITGEISNQEARQTIKEYYQYVNDNPVMGITINKAKRAFIRAKWKLSAIKNSLQDNREIA